MAGGLYLSAVMGLAGACGGSFAATAALRSLRREQALSGRSHCDGCGVPLGALATVPIVSYPLLRGACRACGMRIEPAHFAGEVTGTGLGVLAFWLSPPVEASLILLLGLILLATSIIDQKSRRLPDLLTLCVAVLALGLATLAGKLLVGVATAAVTFGALVLVRRGFLKVKGYAGLGAGDVKLLAALSIWLGLATPWVLALASSAALAVILIGRPTRGMVAFGPFIAASALAIGLLLPGRILTVAELLP